MWFGKELVVNARAIAASEVFYPPNAVVPENASMASGCVAVIRQNDLIVISASHFDGRIV